MRTNTGEPGGHGLIAFEIRDGVRRVRCEVSNQALEAASGLADGAPAMLRRRSFDRFRVLIHAAAAIRISALPPGSTDTILLTAHDLRCVSAERGTQQFGVAGRTPSARPELGIPA